MNIGVINPELIYPRGAEKQACKLCYFLDKKGHDVTFYTFQKAKSYIFDPLLSNVEIISLNKPWIWTTHWTMDDLRWIYLIRKLSRELGNHDIINAHNHPAQWISKYTDIPVVWMCNEPYMHTDYINNNYFKSTHYKIDNYFSTDIKLILSLDNKMEEIIKKMYPDKPTKTIGSGVDLERKIKHIKNDYFDSIFVGPIHPQKRPLDIVKAFALIKDKIPNIKLHFVGEITSKNLKKEMENIAKANKLNINFYGYVSDEKLYELYDTADIAIFVPESEPWGIFPLETILGGIPTIISDQCGSSCLVNRDYVINTGNLSEIARKILEIYNGVNSKFIERDMKKNLLQNCSWSTYSSKIENILKNSLNKD